VTTATPGDPTEAGRTTAAHAMSVHDLQAVTFHETRGLKAGYNEDEVDDFIDRVADHLQTLLTRLATAEAQVAGHGVAQVHAEASLPEAATVIDDARKTADATMLAADQYSVHAMDEARQVLRDAETAAARLEAARQLLERQIADLTRLREHTYTEVRRFIMDRLTALDLSAGSARQAPVSDQGQDEQPSP
jgi:DivIVA domain-containing protein